MNLAGAGEGSVDATQHDGQGQRVTVAEALEVLDDQLVQSDIQTMAFFRELLKEKAGSVQVVVL